MLASPEQVQAVGNIRIGGEHAIFTKHLVLCPDDRIDYWLDIRWNAPASFYLSAGHAPAGQGRYHGAELSSVQILTPASADRCYYFFKHYRNYRRDDVVMTKELEKSIRDVFATEDEPMIASVQKNMAGRDLMELKPVLLPCDAAAMRVRRARERILDLEAAGAAQSRMSVA